MYNRVTKSWNNLGLYQVEAVTITPSNILYAATKYEGLYKSTDLGNTWTMTNLPSDTLILYNVLAISDDSLFASTLYDLRRSSNGGLTWNSLSITAKTLKYENNTLWCIGNGSILFKSTNFGNLFDSLFSGFTGTGTINSLSLTNNGYIFLINWGDPVGIMRSTDFGGTFGQVLFSDRGTAVFSNYAGVVITGTLSKIYISSDYGNTWTAFNQPFLISDIKQDQNNKYFFGTFNAGLYEVDIVTNVEEELNNNYDFSLSQNYPNPFNSQTVISYQIKEEGVVQLKVYDLLGRLVSTLVNEPKLKGEYTVTFDAADLPSGVYFYKLQSGSYSETRKLVLSK
jgi:hypothetical protein